MDDLRRRWGDEFDDNAALAGRTLRHFLDDGSEDGPVMRLADGTPLNRFPPLMEGFARIGRRVGDGGGVPKRRRPGAQ